MYYSIIVYNSIIVYHHFEVILLATEEVQDKSLTAILHIT